MVRITVSEILILTEENYICSMQSSKYIRIYMLYMHDKQVREKFATCPLDSQLQGQITKSLTLNCFY